MQAASKWGFEGFLWEIMTLLCLSEHVAVQIVCLGYALPEALGVSAVKPINKECCHAHT